MSGQTVCGRLRLHHERQSLPRPDVDGLGMRLSAALRNLTFIAVRRRCRPVTAPVRANWHARTVADIMRKGEAAIETGGSCRSDGGEEAPRRAAVDDNVPPIRPIPSFEFDQHLTG